ncbi:A disintegrin and metalloproteinase with thrombospondin motifs 17 [Varanus komodoensis]|nr:A disintegrin and metalloproteinase with thrombospondin motifs 17 [Varanus komodoensis]
MFDGPFLPLVPPVLLPLLLLLLLREPGTSAASAELAVVIPEQVPLDRMHFLQGRGSSTAEGRRGRRSVLLQAEDATAEALLIRLPAGIGPDPGSELYLVLHWNMWFLAPGFSVEEIGEDQSSHQVDVSRLCFYTGFVLNRSLDSFASLHVCGGLVLIYVELPLRAP